MVMRYAHPQEKHQADAVKRLEAFNAAKEIAEASVWGAPFHVSPTADDIARS